MNITWNDFIYRKLIEIISKAYICYIKSIHTICISKNSFSFWLSIGCKVRIFTDTWSNYVPCMRDCASQNGIRLTGNYCLICEIFHIARISIQIMITFISKAQLSETNFLRLDWERQQFQLPVYLRIFKVITSVPIEL